MRSVGGRAYFQIHLSTSVVLMCAAGILVGANFGQHKRFTERDVVGFVTENEAEFRHRLKNIFLTTRNYRAPITIDKAYGWPCCCLITQTDIDVGSIAAYENAHLDSRYFSLSNTIIDLTIAIVILAGIWVVCERSIRRRGARKIAPSP